MLEQVGTALTKVIGWVGDVLSALIGTDGALNELLPLLAVGIAISAMMFSIKAIKGFIWGA